MGLHVGDQERFQMIGRASSAVKTRESRWRTLGRVGYHSVALGIGLGVALPVWRGADNGRPTAAILFLACWVGLSLLGARISRDALRAQMDAWIAEAAKQNGLDTDEEAQVRIDVLGSIW